MICKNCNAEVADNAAFCHQCGNAIKKKQANKGTVIAILLCCTILTGLLVLIFTSFDSVNNSSHTSKSKKVDSMSTINLGLTQNANDNNLLNYFKSVSNKPLIIYYCNDIAKDETISFAYVIKNGKCRKYDCSTTLGELSKMTDNQILEMLEDYYQDGLSEALSIWRSEHNTAAAISSGKVKLYDPRSYDIKGCLFTDSTGNSVVGELLFFPVTGVSDSPYIIEYPQYTDYEDQFMNYYGTSEDSSSYRDIKFDVKYFNTGYGTQSDINQINDIYYITSSSVTTGTVYNSNYYGLKSMDNEWAYGGTLCFRVDNPAYFSLNLDELSSSNVSYVDPTENNILQISRSYYNAYYSSFKTLE